MKMALITEIRGEHGSYLAEFLLQKGYEVHGTKRRASQLDTSRVDHLYEDPHASHLTLLFHCDTTDSNSVISVVQRVKPDEIYNLRAQRHVGVSFEQPEYTADTDALGTLRLLEAMRTLGLNRKTRFYQASMSQL
jgi:GDPmannose 4,6-dehydratase